MGSPRESADRELFCVVKGSHILRGVNCMPLMGHGIIWSCAHDGQNTKKNFVRRFICFNTQKNKKANGEKINKPEFICWPELGR